MPQLEYDKRWWKDHYRQLPSGEVTTVERHQKKRLVRTSDIPKPKKTKSISLAGKPPIIPIEDRKYIVTFQQYDDRLYGKDKVIHARFSEVQEPVYRHGEIVGYRPKRMTVKARNIREARNVAIEEYGEDFVRYVRTHGENDRAIEMEVEENLGTGKKEDSIDVTVDDVLTYSTELEGGKWFKLGASGKEKKGKSIDEIHFDEGERKIAYGADPVTRYIRGGKGTQKKEVLTLVTSYKALKQKEKSKKGLNEYERDAIQQYEKDRDNNFFRRRKGLGKGRWERNHKYIYFVVQKKDGEIKAVNSSHNTTPAEGIKDGTNYHRSFTSILARVLYDEDKINKDFLSDKQQDYEEDIERRVLNRKDLSDTRVKRFYTKYRVRDLLAARRERMGTRGDIRGAEKGEVQQEISKKIAKEIKSKKHEEYLRQGAEYEQSLAGTYVGEKKREKIPSQQSATKISPSRVSPVGRLTHPAAKKITKGKKITSQEYEDWMINRLSNNKKIIPARKMSGNFVDNAHYHDAAEFEQSLRLVEM